MLVLHVSDTHLGAIPGGLLFRFRDILEAFKETVDIAIREHVDIYIHAGDFFDRAHPPPEAYIVAYKQLKRLRDSGIRVVVIAGQHDMPKRYSVSPLTFLAETGVADIVAINDVIRSVITVNGKEYELVLVPYGCRDRISLIKPSIANSILVAHLLLKELGLPVHDASVNDIANFKYVALGDYHEHRILRHPTGTPIVYSGATETLRRDEYSEAGKYVVLADLSGDEAQIQLIKLSSVRPWIIGEYQSLAQAIEDVSRRARSILAQGLKKPMIVVTIKSQITQLAYREFDKLVKQGLIEYYTIEGVESESDKKRFESTQYLSRDVDKLDLRAALKSILKMEPLVDMVLELIQDPSDITAKKLVEMLINNEDLLRSLEMMASHTHTVTTVRTSSSGSTSLQPSTKSSSLISFLRREK